MRWAVQDRDESAQGWEGVVTQHSRTQVVTVRRTLLKVACCWRLEPKWHEEGIHTERQWYWPGIGLWHLKGMNRVSMCHT